MESREIKFRAFEKENNAVRSVTHIDFELRIVRLIMGREAESNWVMQDEFSFKHIELMQYTGLKDKYGVEIYEGDIVKHWTTAYRNNLGVQIGRVHFHYGEYVLCDHIKNDTFNRVLKSFNSFEVVGNIYENEEIMIEHEAKLEEYVNNMKKELLK